MKYTNISGYNLGYGNDSYGREDEYAGLTPEQRKMAMEAKRASSELSRNIDKEMAEYERSHPGEEEKEEKFLGILPMPGYMIGVVEGTWNMALGYAAPWIQKNAYKAIDNHGVSLAAKVGLKLDPKHVGRAAVIAGVASAVIPVALQPVSALVRGYGQEHKDLTNAAKKLAPVLDDIKGKHSLSAFMSVNAEQNEMIYAYRRHKQATHQLVHTNNFLSFLNIAPSLVLTSFNSKGVIENAIKNKASVAPAVGAPVTAAPHHDGNGIQVASGIASGAVTPLIDTFKKVNERKHQRKSNAYTAMDLVLELDKQVSAEPNQSSYAFPRGAKKSSAPLVDYVMEIIRCHQMDMEGLDAEYTPIRKALDNQLRDVATPIAEAIKKGDISTLALIRLVGEGHIIKNKGRSLAKPSEVKALLEKMSATTTSYTQVDPKEYFADAAFNKKELKEALDALKGEERLQFASMFPDTVLHEVGMSEKDIKELRAATVKNYEAQLGKMILGLAAEDDQALHEIGLAKEEVKELRGIADKIREHGDEAVHEVASKANNPIGFERVVAGAAISKILSGDVAYLGKLSSQASVSKSETHDIEAEADVDVKDPVRSKPHAEKVTKHAGHASRETHRREYGAEHNERADLG